MVFASVDQVFQNATPTLFDKVSFCPFGQKYTCVVQAKDREETEADWDEDVRDEFDAREIFDLIKEIRDPEHPMSLEELGFVIQVSSKIIAV